MQDVAIVAAGRTAVGTAKKGTLAETSAMELGHSIVGAVAERAGLPASSYDDVILGEQMYGGGDIARHAAITNGMLDVPGTALNRHCASGLTAVATAAGSIGAGMDRAVIAGGVESRSTAPVPRFRVPASDEWIDPWMPPTHPDREDAPNADMSITVGWNAAKLADVSREDMDAWALRSHQNAIRAIDEGRFDDEIVPVQALMPDGSRRTFDVDEHPRRGTSMEKLASLKPLHPEIPGFSITAGNAAGVNDAAAAVTLADMGSVEEHGLEPLAFIRSWSAVGVDPYETGLAPTKAIPKALERAGVRQQDIDLIELNEAFASMCVACIRILDLDPEIVNTSGSGCSLGHPVAATGARMLTTLIYELRRQGGGLGLAAMCAGGGMSGAMVVEVPRA